MHIFHTKRIHPEDDTTRQARKAYVLSGTHTFHWVFEIAFTTDDSFVEDQFCPWVLPPSGFIRPKNNFS